MTRLETLFSSGMSNVLNNEKKQEVLALGRLGWSVRRIEQATGIRRETASVYLKSAGIAVRLPGGRLAKPATKVATDSVPAKPATRVATDPDGAQPNRDELLPDGPEPGPSHTPAEEQNPPLSEKSVSAANDSDRPEPRSCAISACEPYEVIELGLSRGRNAMAIWQDLVSQHGFAHQYGSVKRWVRKQRGQQTPPAIPIIVTA